MSNKTYTNPWAGLSSYQDPETADVQLKFCGRDNESFDVAQLIDDNIFVTLYGKSGTGKTSLLNAGVFPRLRQEQYLPVSIRLGMEAFDISFQQCVLTKISQALQGKGTQTTFEVVPMPADEQSTEYLWSYFARTQFTAADGSTLFPVLVFDQFEEVFRNRREEAETLLRQIHFMMDENHALSDRIVNGQPYQYDFNFRFVASIREDDLYRLEDSIDNCYLPELKRCRYRLRSLSEQGAKDVILIPGEGLFKAEEQKDIVEKIISKSRNEDGSISTNIISLLCSRIFTYHSSLSTREAFISPTIVDSFLKGNPFEKFYNEATRGFSNREKSYIEEHLVDSTGRRNSIPESDFLLHVKNGTVLLDGERKILQRTSTSSDGGNYRVELIHDSFCEPLAQQKEKRGQRRRIRLILTSIAVVACIIGAAWLYMGQMIKASENMRENIILNTVQKSKLYLNHGDSYRARIVLLDILPKSPNEFCPPVIEEALRSAVALNNAVLTGHTNAVNSACFSSDEKRILSASWDGTIKLWDVWTGTCVKTLSGNSMDKADFCPVEKKIISLSEDCINVWSLESGKIIKSIKANNFEFSPDKHYLLIFKETIELCNSESLECIKTFKGSDKWRKVIWHANGKDLIVYTIDKKLIKVNIKTEATKILCRTDGDGILINMVISQQGDRIAAAFGYMQDNKPGFIKIWDSETGKCLHTLRDKSEWTNDVAWSPDGEKLVSTSMGGDVLLWDTESGTCLDILKGHAFASGQPVFTRDGKKLITISADFTLRIWDMKPVNQIQNFDYCSNSECVLTSYNNRDKILIQGTDSICEYDAKSMKRLFTLPPSPCSSVKSAYDDKGKIIAASYHNDSLYLYNFDKKEWQQKLVKKKLNIWQIAFGKTLAKTAVFTTDSTFKILDLTKEKLIKNLGKQTYNCRRIGFSNDEKLLVQECSDSIIRIWNTDKWKCEKEIKAINNSFNCALISVDNKYLITSNESEVYVWDIKKEKCIRAFEGLTASVYSMAQSRDGKYLVTTSHDCNVRVWDFASGVCLQNKRLTQYSSSAFNSDGTKILLGGYKSGIIDFPPLQQLIDETRKRFKDRPLTKEERRKYYLE